MPRMRCSTRRSAVANALGTSSHAAAIATPVAPATSIDHANTRPTRRWIGLPLRDNSGTNIDTRPKAPPTMWSTRTTS